METNVGEDFQHSNNHLSLGDQIKWASGINE